MPFTGLAWVSAFKIYWLADVFREQIAPYTLDTY